MNGDYTVRGYAGASHPRAYPGDKLLETRHRGETSMQIEVEAWKARMRRGEVSRVEVIDHATHETRTIYPEAR